MKNQELKQSLENVRCLFVNKLQKEQLFNTDINKIICHSNFKCDKKYYSNVYTQYLLKFFEENKQNVYIHNSVANYKRIFSHTPDSFVISLQHKYIYIEDFLQINMNMVFPSEKIAKDEYDNFKKERFKKCTSYYIEEVKNILDHGKSIDQLWCIMYKTREQKYVVANVIDYMKQYAKELNEQYNEILTYKKSENDQDDQTSEEEYEKEYETQTNKRLKIMNSSINNKWKDKYFLDIQLLYTGVMVVLGPYIIYSDLNEKRRIFYIDE
jgi:hypothetical protein